MFSYITSTDEELLEHVRTSSAAKISVAKRYHESKGNFEIVARIEQARKTLRIIKMIANLERMKEV